MKRVTLSLVSHTNAGKTTLTRTLLRRDVGEVLDQAHVTEVAEGFTLIATGDSELWLWDTPGFGDSARLLKRLKRHSSPLLWFVTQVWDRITDRPLWSSQQAALNIRDEADVVLYLVNAAEEPEEAGYVAPELEILGWIGRPIVLLLNQTGDVDASSQAMAERLDAWRRHAERFVVVREVLPLDAFSRCWVQESLLLYAIVPLLPRERRATMEALAEAWNQRNLEVFERATSRLARYLAAAAVDGEQLADQRPDRAEKKRGMEALGERLERAGEDLMAALLELHGLKGTAGAEIERQLDAYAVDGDDLINAEKGAVWGGVVSGAVGGLTADFMAGGLSFGGGMLAGMILGALGGAGLARGFQLVKSGKLPEVSWTPAFLDRLSAQILLRYLAVAHFGRGRGEFRDHDASHHWQAIVAGALRRRSEEWREVWDAAVGEDPRYLDRWLEEVLDDTLRAILVTGYPEASELLGVEAEEEEEVDQEAVGDGEASESGIEVEEDEAGEGGDGETSFDRDPEP